LVGVSSGDIIMQLRGPGVAIDWDRS